MNLTPTAGMELDAQRIRDIKALATRDFEPESHNTMVSCLDPNETALDGTYKAVRAAHGQEVYRLQARCDDASESGRDGPLPILVDGDTRRQVGAVTVDEDGRATAKFSRSERGRQARQAFASGGAVLSIAYLQRSTGRRAAAFSLRDTGKASNMENEAKQIAAMGRKYDRSDLATQAIEDGLSLTEFREAMLDAIGSKPLDFAAPALHGRAHGYSLGAALRGQMTGKLSGVEAEVHEELARQMPTTPRGVMVPNLLLHRTTMDSANIANLVGSQPRGDLFIDRLQPASAVMQAGATVLSGLSKAVTIPKETAELSASFVAEGAAIAESSLTIGSISMTPRRVSSTASFTLEALVQSDPQIDNLIRTSLTRQIAQAIDNAALNGDGVAPNPTGIVNTSGINTLITTGSSTMTYAEALAALSSLEADNVDSAGAVFLVNPSDYATIAATLVDSGSGRFVIEDGRILGRRIVQSTLASAGTVVLGDFRQAMIGFFGGTDLVVDNVTEARSAKVLVTQHQMADVAIRHAVAFCAVTLTA
jgi:hypothetical protein